MRKPDFYSISNEFEKYGYKIISDSSEYKNVLNKLDIIDNDGYKYKIGYNGFCNTIRQGGRPLRISTYNPYSIYNLSLLLMELGYSHKIISTEVSKIKSNIILLCLSCNREFSIVLGNLKSRNLANCPYCNHKIIVKETSLFNKCPELLNEWDFEKNKNIDIDSVGCNSRKEYWWICSKCGNNWKWSASNKYSNFGTTGCPKCNIKSLSDNNNLLSSPYNLEKFWDYDKNSPLLPKDIYVRSGKKYWWHCNTCGYSWKSSCDKFSRAKGNCSRCSGYIISDKNRLSFLRPDLLSEWNYKKNEGIDVDSVFISTMNKYWWVCSLGHEWQASPANRNKKNSGCPVCRESKGEKKIKKFLDKHNIDNIPQYKNSKCRNQRVLPFDFAVFIDNNMFMIEYHGGQHYKPIDWFGSEEAFENLQIRDKIKFDYCKNNNIPLIIIPYWDFDKIEEILAKELIL